LGISDDRGASVAAGPPWVVEEVISEDLPSCISDIVSHEQTEEILILTNDCSEPVTLRLLECTELECDGDSVTLVRGGEAMGIYSEDLGLSDGEIAAETTFTATLGWSRADDDRIAWS
jgi:hypothetical protein